MEFSIVLPSLMSACLYLIQQYHYQNQRLSKSATKRENQTGIFPSCLEEDYFCES
jgi:hypothetical protein